MAKLTDKQKLLAIGGGTLFLCLLAGGGSWWAHGLIDEERTAIETKKQQIAAAQQKIDKIPSVEKDVIILRENLGEYVKILPENKDLNVFAKMFNQFERQSGVSITMFKPGRPARGGPSRFSKVEYQFTLDATIWQLLKFMNFIENYERFVKITDITITSGAKGSSRDVEMRDGDMVHSVKLTVETYVYNTKGAAPDVAIPNYKNKRDALREEIFKRLQAIRIDRYEHRGGLGRRDIFVDPRQETGPGNTKRGVPIQDQKNIIERFTSEVSRLREMFNRAKRPDVTIFERYSLERALREGIVQVQANVDEVTSKGLISYPPYLLRWTKDVTQPLMDLNTALENPVVDQGGPEQRDPFLKTEDFERLISSMTDDLMNGNLEEATARFDSVRDKLEVPAGHERYELAVKAKGLYVRATTAIEFSNLDIDIEGVLVNQDGKSGVLLNGTVYEEGEYISDDLFVKSVGEEHVEFVFRGFSLIKTL